MDDGRWETELIRAFPCSSVAPWLREIRAIRAEGLLGTNHGEVAAGGKSQRTKISLCTPCALPSRTPFGLRDPSRRGETAGVHRIALLMPPVFAARTAW